MVSDAAKAVADGDPRRIAITGLGAVTPLGIGAQTLHDRWVAGDSAISDGRAWCDDFRAADFLSRREIRASDRFTQLALAAGEEAIVQARWNEALPCAPHRIG